MLVDAAKHGDVEIPFFCYEPKLGQPVGACRMCLVEIEGIPKLQTSCSTPVRDGMVVNTTSDRVKHAQNAIVEFLLVNHPLDCPVCDKGGECPLQDISYGWGAGRSRFIEPKRHFKKPLELSPLVAIDRERCILCYRCVRFSQEVAEDYQLVFLERGDHTFVGTHDGRPYVAPFSGNIIELCPVGALTSRAYRFRARPWDIEDSGTVCTLCPSQCNVKLTDPRRREGRARARARQRRGRRRLALRQGPLRLPVVRLRRAHHRAARARRRLPARGVLGARALGRRRRCLKRSGADTVARGRRLATNEEGFLVQHLLRKGLGSPHVDARAGGRATGSPARSPAWTCPRGSRTSTTPTRSSCSTPSSSTRRRSSTCACARRCAATTPGWWSRRAAPRRSTRTPRRAALRSGAAEAALAALGGAARRAARGRRSTTSPAAPAPRPASSPAARAERRRAADPADAVRAAADVLRDAGDVVVIWGERRLAGERGEQGLEALLALADALGIAGRDESGLIASRPDQRARPARGRLLAGARPGPRGRPEAGDPDAARGALLLSTPSCRRPSSSRRASVIAFAQLPHRGARGAGGHRLPGRDLRREGGHGHPPGRPPPARAPGARPRRRGARRLGGARRALRADGAGRAC